MAVCRAGLSFLVGAALLVPSVALARPTLLFEPYDGTIFYAEDADVPWFPASLTKLMTAYVAFEALKALIVVSANDAAIMIAEGVAGSDEAFVQRMNETAQRLGITHTHYVRRKSLPCS